MPTPWRGLLYGSPKTGDGIPRGLPRLFRHGFHVSLRKIISCANIFFVKFWNDVQSAETLFGIYSDVGDHDGAVEISISPLIIEILTFWKNKKLKFIISLVSWDTEISNSPSWSAIPIHCTCKLSADSTSFENLMKKNRGTKNLIFFKLMWNRLKLGMCNASTSLITMVQSKFLYPN